VTFPLTSFFPVLSSFTAYYDFSYRECDSTTKEQTGIYPVHINQQNYCYATIDGNCLNEK